MNGDRIDLEAAWARQRAAAERRAQYARLFRTYGDEALAFADCRRCGKPAFPISGYCSAWCEETERYDYWSSEEGQKFIRSFDSFLKRSYAPLEEEYATLSKPMAALVTRTRKRKRRRRR